MNSALYAALLADAMSICVPEDGTPLCEFHDVGEFAGTGIMVFAASPQEGQILGSVWMLGSDGEVFHKNWSSREREVLLDYRNEELAGSNFELVETYHGAFNGSFIDMVLDFKQTFWLAIRAAHGDSWTMHP